MKFHELIERKLSSVLQNVQDIYHTKNKKKKNITPIIRIPTSDESRKIDESRLGKPTSDNKGNDLNVHYTEL